MDDWNASTSAPIVTALGTHYDPRALTTLDTARSFMDDNRPSI